MQVNTQATVPMDHGAPVDLRHAVQEFAAAVEGAPGTDPAFWVHGVRRKAAALRARLDAEPVTPSGWLSPRCAAVERERVALVAQLREVESNEPQQASAARLVTDLTHHLQHRSDLAYDDVEAEIGGSE